MITEDYCSYEVSKLLKEKGFQEPCTGLNKLLCKEGEKPVLKITHQKAMKWLREKGIHMSIDTVISSSENIYFNIDTYSEDSGWNHPVDFYDSYEEAVEVALKYCLENLI